jgi:hypothetical protein
MPLLVCPFCRRKPKPKFANARTFQGATDIILWAATSSLCKPCLVDEFVSCTRLQWVEYQTMAGCNVAIQALLADEIRVVYTAAVDLAVLTAALR